MADLNVFTTRYCWKHVSAIIRVVSSNNMDIFGQTFFGRKFLIFFTRVPPWYPEIDSIICMSKFPKKPYLWPRWRRVSPFIKWIADNIPLNSVLHGEPMSWLRKVGLNVIKIAIFAQKWLFWAQNGHFWPKIGHFINFRFVPPFVALCSI